MKSTSTNVALCARIERAAHMVYLHGATEAEVAAELGIKPVTLRDWKKRPEWEQSITLLRDAQRKTALDRLSMLTENAVAALEQSLEGDNDSVRLKAAIWILERSSLTRTEEGPTEFELHLRSVTGHGA